MKVVWILLSAFLVSTLMFFWLTELLRMEETTAQMVSVVFPFAAAFILILVEVA